MADMASIVKFYLLYTEENLSLSKGRGGFPGTVKIYICDF